MFVKPNIRKGILPQLLNEVLKIYTEAENKMLNVVAANTKKSVDGWSAAKLNDVANIKSNTLLAKRHGSEIADFSNVRKGMPSCEVGINQ